MKIAITCDYLISKGHYAEVLETLCDIYPECKIYTFVHKEGALLGHIEQRKITSTYLSKDIHSVEDFYAHSSKLPLLAKNMFVSCEYDLIINVSRGLSHGFKKCEKTKQLTYLYDLGFEGKIKNTFIQKLAYPWFLNFFVNSFKNADLILVSNDELKIDLERYIGSVDVLYPPFKISDYSLFPKDMFKHHFYLVDTANVNEDLATKLIGFFDNRKTPFQFIGNDFHLKNIKEKYLIERPNLFFGNRCAGEHAPVLASAKMFISFEDGHFPKLSLATLATGRPVLIMKNQKHWISGLGIYSIKNIDLVELQAALNQFELEEENIDGPKLRALVNNFHETKFKTSIKRAVSSLFGQNS
jgi:hypothetical protein